MSNDILDEVRSIRPDADDLERLWPADARERLAERIRGDELDGRLLHRSQRRPRRRALVAASVLVAAAVIAAVAVPALLPEGVPGSASPAAAAALHRLADVAASSPIDTAGPGQYVHTVVRERQTGFPDGSPDGSSVGYLEESESWRASDGRTWRRDTGLDIVTGAPGATDSDYFPPDGTDARLAALPTDPGELTRHLRDTVSGSNSTDEAVFVAVGDLLRDNAAPAALRAAAVGVLARTDHVTLGAATVDSLGRTVEEFDFRDDSARAGVVESLFFDPATAQVIDERTTSADSTYLRTVLRSDVVDAVPADVVRTAQR